MRNKDIIGTTILSLLFVFIAIAGIISYQSIDWTILQRIEKQQLILPTPIVSPTDSATQSMMPSQSVNLQK